MIKNLPEAFLYAKIPEAVVSLDERGVIAAVVGGVQDRLDDLRSYSRKLAYLLDPYRLPDPENNVVLCELRSGQGVVYTRSLDFQSDTPPPSDLTALTRWAARELGVDVQAVANARYGRDLYRLMDAGTLAYLAETIGAVLYRTQLATASDARQIVATYFPRLKIKGTAASFEVLGRILGFDDLAYRPLWTRLSPRMPNDPGAGANDPDFTATPEFWPKQITGPDYDPHVMRDGPFYAWSGTCSNGTGVTDYYLQVVNGFNPWVELALLDRVAGPLPAAGGTLSPPVTNGTASHIPEGAYLLANGAAHTRAYVDPAGSSFRIRAIAEGESWNGLKVRAYVSDTGSRVLWIDDRLSTVKYRSSYFDLHATTDWDRAGMVFGERSVRANRDLAATAAEQPPGPPLTLDGPATSPYRPWTGGSVATGSLTGDWLVRDAHSAPVVIELRTQADATDRELPYEAIEAAGLQVAASSDEVRPATRFHRTSAAGLLSQDEARYACYLSRGLLFTTATGVLSYSGSHVRTPLPGYYADITVEPPPVLKISWNSVPERPYEVRATPDQVTFTVIGRPYGASGTNVTNFLVAVVGTYSFFRVYDLSNGAQVATKPSLSSEVFKSNSEIDPANPQLGHYRYQDRQLTNLEMSGTYRFDSGTYRFDFVDGVPNAAGVYALWTATDTGTIRDEPLRADKTGGDVACQIRPEDDPDGGEAYSEPCDEYPWLRPVSGGGERMDGDTTLDELAASVFTVSDTVALYDQSGVAHDLWVMPSGANNPPRMEVAPRRVDDGYQPGAVALGWQGSFRDLASYTEQERQFLNPQTDPEILLSPGSSVHRVGLVKGVLVADPEGFFRPSVRDYLAGWHPFDEHPLDGLQAADRVQTDGVLEFEGIGPQDRVWDETRGYVLRMRPGTSASGLKAQFLGDDFSLCFRLRIVPSGGTGTVTFFSYGPVSIDLACASGALSAYVRHPDGSRLAIGTVVPTSGVWAFVSLRKGSGMAAFGLDGVETQVVDTFDGFTPDERMFALASGQGDLALHDLRFWSVVKSASDLDFVRTFQPAKTRTLYRLPWVQAAGTLDRYGLRVLANGWVVPGSMPPWARHASEIQVVRYSSSGSYVGHRARKEVGLGGGIATPPDVGAAPVFQLGFVYPLPQSLGVYVTASKLGILPSAGGVWHDDSAPTSYLELSGGLGANGSLAVAVPIAGATTWPDTVAKTNAGVDAVWLEGDDDWVYRVALSGAPVPGLTAVREPARTRTEGEILVNPVYKSLSATGTYWDGTFSGTQPPSSARATIVGPGHTTTHVYIGSLSDAEVFAGATTVLRDGSVGLRVKPSGNSTQEGTVYQGPVAGPKSPPWWLYRHARILESVSNAWETWVYGGVDEDATRFGNRVQDHPDVPVPVAALETNGQLDFQNPGVLTAGRYRLTLDVGNIGTLDPGFDGFEVEISINGAPRLPVRLLAGRAGYNSRGREVVFFEVAASVPDASPWLVTILWTNAYSDPQKGVQRQLVVYAYLVERVETEMYRVSVPGPVLSYVTPYSGTYDSTTTGGWLQSMDNSGVLRGLAHESNVRPQSDSGTSSIPLAELLSGCTQERLDDIVVRSASGLSVPPDQSPSALPSFGALVAVTVPQVAVPLWLWCGPPCASAVEIRAKMPFDAMVRLIYFTQAGFSTGNALGVTDEVEASKSANNRVARFRISNLIPGAVYGYAVETAGVLSLDKIGQFTALGTGPTSFRFVLGNCSLNVRGAPASNKTVYDTILAQNPLFMLVAGDLHYNSVATDSEDLNEDALDAIFISSGSYAFQTAPTTNVGSDRQEFLWSQVPVIWTWNDRDYGINNSDRTAPGRRAARTVYRRYVPQSDLQAGGPDAAIYRSFRIGRSVFILSDNRSERSPNADPDNAAKTIYSATQLAWWKSTVLAAAKDPDIKFIFWLNVSPWIGATAAGVDSWAGYNTQRQEIVTWLAAQGVTKLYILSGDMAASAFDDGRGSPGGLPVFHAGPLDQTSASVGGPYQIGPYPATPTAVTQFGVIDVTDDGTEAPSVSFKALDQDGAILTGASGPLQATLTHSPHAP